MSVRDMGCEGWVFRPVPEMPTETPNPILYRLLGCSHPASNVSAGVDEGPSAPTIYGARLTYHTGKGWHWEREACIQCGAPRSKHAKSQKCVFCQAKDRREREELHDYLERCRKFVLNGKPCRWAAPW